MQAVRWYVADVVAGLISLLCDLTGHAHGCWIMQGRWSPLRRLHWWAIHTTDTPEPPSHHACAVCGFDHTAYVRRSEYNAATDRAYEEGKADGMKSVFVPYAQTTTGTLNTATLTVTRWPSC